jgi:hypothetical protein
MSAFKVSILFLVLVMFRPDASAGRTIGDLPVPAGFVRRDYQKLSYQQWIKSLPIKNENIILKYDGCHIVSSFYDILAVVDMPMLFKSDIEQCADWCFRFWAEFHRQNGLIEKLYLLDYNGRHKRYSNSGVTLKTFLKKTMVSANSFSIKKGCRPIDPNDLQPGDMLVQNRLGGIGHVSVIMDVCENPSGETLYLIGFGFMPAQQFHIERSDSNHGRGGWYTIDGYTGFLREHLDYGNPEFRRF